MTIKNNTILQIIAVLVLASLFFGTIQYTHANPLAYATGSQTASATSSPVFMTPGTGTSTLPYDANAAGRPTAADTVGLLVQLSASSTATTLNIAFEYAVGAPGLDCYNTPLSCDWYKDNTITTVTATTSQAFWVTQANSYNWTFASSSQAGAGVAANNNRSMKIINVPVAARYVRANFSLPVGSANGAVWAQFVPAKENN